MGVGREVQPLPPSLMGTGQGGASPTGRLLTRPATGCPFTCCCCCCWRWKRGGRDFWNLLNSCAGDPASPGASSPLPLWATAADAGGASSEHVLGASWAENSGEPGNKRPREQAVVAGQQVPASQPQVTAWDRRWHQLGVPHRPRFRGDEGPRGQVTGGWDLGAEERAH